MELPRMPYKDLQTTMQYLRDQIIDSYEYAYDVCPRFSHPRQVFEWLKLRTTYVNDPEDTELIQSMQTLFDNNWHGLPGAGDCDCFTVAAMACLAVQGWNNQDIYLVGRKVDYAQHIYSGIYFNNNYYILDLTNPWFDQERHYPYRQILHL